MRQTKINKNQWVNMITGSKDKKKEETIKGMVVIDSREINIPESEEVVAEAAEEVVEAEAVEAEEEREMIITPMEVPDKTDPAKNTTLLTLTQTTGSSMKMM
jgi:hypothetical protein